MDERNDIAVAVLAGGEGSRIGGNKPFIELCGASLLERAWDFAKSSSDTVTLVLRKPDPDGSFGHSFTTDRPGIEGPLAGLAAGFDWARRVGKAALLTIPCDMPLLPSDLVLRLRNEIGGAAAAIASSGGQIHPVCGLWKVHASEEIAPYHATGGQSLWGFARAVGFAEVKWPIGPMDPFFNINRSTDLAEIAEYLETRN